MHQVGNLIIRSAKWLQEKGVDSPRLDAELLLAHVLGCDRLRLYMEWEKPLMELEVSAYRELIRRRGQSREPVARLVGHKEFHKRSFEVTRAVFQPRPETEGVVERALEMLATDKALQVDRPVVLEVGTGSGCIVVSLAAEHAAARYIATELDAEALAVARRNAERHHVLGRIEFRHGPCFGGYDGPIHLLVSNPPYISSAEVPNLPPEVLDHDPRSALDGGADGLDLVREMIAGARRLLVPGGCVVMELGEDQESAVLQLCAKTEIFAQATMERDLAGRPRYLVARRESN